MYVCAQKQSISVHDITDIYIYIYICVCVYIYIYIYHVYMSSMLCFFAYLLNDYIMALVLTCLLLSFLV